MLFYASAFSCVQMGLILYLPPRVPGSCKGLQCWEAFRPASLLHHGQRIQELAE